MAFSARVESSAISQINVTPLVDVLLVLLIIFMISAPVIVHKARVDLPQANPNATPDLVEPVRLTIEAGGAMYWNDTLITDAGLATQLTIAAAQAEQPALHIAAADNVAYEDVASVLAEAKVRGMNKIDFVSTR
jgi:biopolymer transport protein ExbD